MPKRDSLRSQNARSVVQEVDEPSISVPPQGEADPAEDSIKKSSQGELDGGQAVIMSNEEMPGGPQERVSHSYGGEDDHQYQRYPDYDQEEMADVVDPED